MIRIARFLFLLLVICTLTAASAMAQSPQGDTFNITTEAPPKLRAATNGTAPSLYLQGATMGTIAPEGAEVQVTVGGVMTAGTVRVNNLANLEAALNIAAYVIEFIWIGLGLYHLAKTVKRKVKTPPVVLRGLVNSCCFVTMGVLTPAALDWGLAVTRSSCLLN
ncbi:MAG: hypothetical protein JST01_25250 [Cyanobacteria bacterium SZAS TMP-1]|nr:hypothetical protein [Cyanobacteria bacterium SZAS TMP-1]